MSYGNEITGGVGVKDFPSKTKNQTIASRFWRVLAFYSFYMDIYVFFSTTKSPFSLHIIRPIVDRHVKITKFCPPSPLYTYASLIAKAAEHGLKLIERGARDSATTSRCPQLPFSPPDDPTSGSSDNRCNVSSALGDGGLEPLPTSDRLCDDTSRRHE